MSLFAEPIKRYIGAQYAYMTEYFEGNGNVLASTQNAKIVAPFTNIFGSLTNVGESSKYDSESYTLPDETFNFGGAQFSREIPPPKWRTRYNKADGTKTIGDNSFADGASADAKNWWSYELGVQKTTEIYYEETYGKVSDILIDPFDLTTTIYNEKRGYHEENKTLYVIWYGNNSDSYDIYISQNQFIGYELLKSVDKQTTGSPAVEITYYQEACNYELNPNVFYYIRVVCNKSGLQSGYYYTIPLIFLKKSRAYNLLYDSSTPWKPSYPLNITDETPVLANYFEDCYNFWLNEIKNYYNVSEDNMPKLLVYFNYNIENSILVGNRVDLTKTETASRIHALHPNMERVDEPIYALPYNKNTTSPNKQYSFDSTLRKQKITNTIGARLKDSNLIGFLPRYVDDLLFLIDRCAMGGDYQSNIEYIPNNITVLQQPIDRFEDWMPETGFYSEYLWNIPEEDLSYAEFWWPGQITKGNNVIKTIDLIYNVFKSDAYRSSHQLIIPHCRKKVQYNRRKFLQNATDYYFNNYASSKLNCGVWNRTVSLCRPGMPMGFITKDYGYILIESLIAKANKKITEECVYGEFTIRDANDEVFQAKYVQFDMKNGVYYFWNDNNRVIITKPDYVPMYDFVIPISKLVKFFNSPTEIYTSDGSVYTYSSGTWTEQTFSAFAKLSSDSFNCYYGNPMIIKRYIQRQYDTYNIINMSVSADTSHWNYIKNIENIQATTHFVHPYFYLRSSTFECNFLYATLPEQARKVPLVVKTDRVVFYLLNYSSYLSFVSSIIFSSFFNSVVYKLVNGSSNYSVRNFLQGKP